MKLKSAVDTCDYCISHGYTLEAANELFPNLLDGLDVPEARQDISIEDNVHWLLRNLAINHGDSEIGDVLTTLKKILP